MAIESLQTTLRSYADSADAGNNTEELCGLLRRAAERIDALNKELRDQERDFQREARDIAAEARWSATQGDEYGSY